MVESITLPPTTVRFDGIEPLQAAHNALAERFHAGDADRAQVCAEAVAFMHRATATGAILYSDAARSAAQGVLNYWSNLLYRTDLPEAEVPPGDLADFDAESGADLTDAEYPFQLTDAAAFEHGSPQARPWVRLIRESLEVLSANRLLAILGAAGSGRSALLRGGLWPELARNGIPAVDGGEPAPVRCLEVVTPAADPLRTLAGLSAPTGADLEAEIAKLRADPAAFARSFPRAEGAVALACDPIQEVCTVASQEDATAFFAAVHAFLEAGHYVVLIVDFHTLSRLGAYDVLARWLDAAQVPVAFDTAETRAMIEEPARRAGLYFDEGVTERLLRDVQGDPAALALLQFTMRRLWQAREGARKNRISRESYQRLGGGWLALQRAADAIFKQASAAGVKRVFLSILTPHLGGFTTRAVPLEEIATAEAPRAEIASIVGKYCEAGLLRLSQRAGRDTVEIVHPALVDHWARLAEWLDEKRLDLRARLALKANAEEWQTTRNPWLLWHGSRLEEALQYKDLNPCETAFRDASDQAECWRRRKKVVAYSTIVGLLLFCAGFLWFTKQREHRRGIADALALSNSFVKEGAHSVEKGDPATAALWFTRALAKTEATIADQLYRREKSDHPAQALARTQRDRLSAILRQMPRLAHRLPHERLSFIEQSRDGKRFVTVTYAEGKVKGVARVWGEDGGPGGDLAIPGVAHTACARLSPSGERVATGHGEAGDEAGLVQLWKASDRSRLQTLPTRGAVTHAAFSPNGTLVAAGVLKADKEWSEVIVWDPASGRQTPLAVAGRIGSLEFNPAGTRLVVAASKDTMGGPGGEALVWAFAEAKSEPLHLTHGAPVSYAEFRPRDGKQVVTASSALDEAGGGEARVWDAATGALVSLPLRHEKAVTSAHFSPDGRRIATASRDMTARIWDIKAGRQMMKLPHDGWVFEASFSPDGRLLATGSRDRTARVWELATGRSILPPLAHGGSVGRAVFTADGRGLITSSPEAGRVWELVTANGDVPSLDTSDPGDSSESWPLAAAIFSADGAQLLTATERNPGDPSRVQVWSAAGVRLPVSMKIMAPVTALAFSHDRTRVAAATRGKGQSQAEVRVWEAATGRLIGEPLGHPGAIRSITFSPRRADRLLTVSEAKDGRPTVLRVWTTGAPKPVTLQRPWPAAFLVATLPAALSAPCFVPLEQPTLFAAFNADGSRILTAGGDPLAKTGETQQWKAETGEPVGAALAHPDSVTFAAYSPDETRIATASTDDKARLWNARTGEMERELKAQSADLTRVRFSPDGKRLVAASYDSTAVIYDLSKKEGGALALRHSGAVNDADFSPDGRRVATASTDRNARLWDAATGELIAAFPHAAEVASVSFHPVQTHLLALSFASRAAHESSSAAVASAPAAVRPRRLREARLWSLTPDARSIATLQKIGEVISGKTIQAEAVEATDPAVAAQDWAALRAEYLAQTPRTPARDFHLQEAKRCEAEDRWFAAAWHLEAALAIPPNADPILRRRCGDAFVAIDDWASADRYYSWARDAFKPEQKTEIAATLLKRARARAELREWKKAAEDCEALIRREFTVAPRAAEREPRLQLALIRVEEARELERQEAKDAALEKWKAARNELEEAATVADNVAVRQRLAVVQLRLGDIAGYEATCRALLDWEHDFAPSRIWPAVLRPQAGYDLRQLAAAVQKGIDESNAERLVFHVNTLAGVRLRLGEHEAALKELERSRRVFAESRLAAQLRDARDETISLSMSMEESRPIDMILLALTHHGLSQETDRPPDFREKHELEAQQWLRKAQDAYDAGERGEGVEAGRPRRVWGQLELGILLEEAAPLIARPKVTQAKL